MVWTLNRLPPRAAFTTAKAGMHADGGGLYLRVTKAGSRQWVFVYRWPARSKNAKRKEFGLGGVNRISLAKARELAQIARDLLADGKNPIEERKVERGIPTFGELADGWIEQREASVRSDKSVDRWKRTLGAEGYAKGLRPLKVNEIETDHVLDVLRPIWGLGPTATLARGYIEAVLDAATARKLRTGENPARWKGHLDHLLPKPQKLARGHHAAMAYADVAAFMKALRSREGVPARALEFAILTAGRTGEVIGATWGEVDLQAKLWTIPAERMKAGRPHTVPLSDRAVELLGDAGEPGAYVFPGAKQGKPLSQMALLMLLRRMGRDDLTAHGFRSTFRDWAGDMTDHPRDLLEAALAHSLGGVEAAYRRASALEKRRTLMKDWARWCDGLGTAANADEPKSEPVDAPNVGAA